MAQKEKSYKSQKKTSSFIVNLVLILISAVFVVPIFGILITSFRQSERIFNSGWWTVFPHKEWVEIGEYKLDADVDLNGEIKFVSEDGQEISGDYSFWKNGVITKSGEKIQYYGAKRSRTLKIYERRWTGFETDLTLENYRNVLSGKKITYKGEDGKLLTRNGSDLSNSFINSLTVTIPATIIPITIAIFAAYGFAWLNFPGRKILFTMVVALLVVPLQIAIVPVLQDFSRIHLNGTFLGIWLAHTGFGLPLAIYLLFNYISEIPRDILESAFIDGATNFSIFTKLILPLSVPAIASFAIFQFLWVWNDYLVALVVLGGGTNEVVTQTLANMVGTKGQDWHLLTAGAFISMIIPMTVFFSLQKYFVRGMMAGSVKG
ncbi:MAG TPA: carbohydrate ABC transporter permease [Flexilinea sp.]|jgi:alpha-glucoside transport system permease protein|nr:MAG: L-arabinose transport system permease protein AraQ [Chloroflexi bacterium ADurb.Bin344]HNY94122.1 carbohydrate ABC transporter permease [Flexilinea sp.]HOG60757.1 carbohydrate ABC transporter permease [Flexilinea sp.]HPG19220.1 carbohydrate ABC transporter permease [Flexilinea sp.]HPL56644.1 carbohydrate ABC transporter permease [Flexilinea sp.]